MTRPKKNSVERRVILDLIFPPRSVNSGIGNGFYQGRVFSFSLPSIITLTDHMMLIGNNAWLWGADLARGYWQLRQTVRTAEGMPTLLPLLAIKVGDNFYLDIPPPFGCRTSALACTRTTRAVVWLLRKKVLFSLCYLDDFVGIESSFDKAVAAYEYFWELTVRLGLALSLSKCTPPARSIVWLGLEMNAENMSVCIEPFKLFEIIEECRMWKSKATKSSRE